MCLEIQEVGDSPAASCVQDTPHKGTNKQNGRKSNEPEGKPKAAALPFKAGGPLSSHCYRAAVQPLSPFTLLCSGFVEDQSGSLLRPAVPTPVEHPCLDLVPERKVLAQLAVLMPDLIPDSVLTSCLTRASVSLRPTASPRDPVVSAMPSRHHQPSQILPVQLA
ncbi:hypothetical protein EYF80_043148 [Liparis tanakae]|uniref:Uncharacterized protein n=1 Tax=Liparis tanakae TaxID=230148 RepID=A0A4Z2FZK2_9TELE|nr:hypothetical protein EYF80_043148 [Liparis tanakae]